MTVFQREIERRLALWGEQRNRKPLPLRGARQVGKTVAVRRFGEHFDCFIELNLEQSSDREPFKHGLEVEEIFQAIVLRKHARPVEGRTLLFLDEIQDCPEAVPSCSRAHTLRESGGLRGGMTVGGGVDRGSGVHSARFRDPRR